MPAKKREQPPGVIQQLLDGPQRFQFMQAMRLLLRQLRDEGVAYETALNDVLRFQNSLSLAFPAGDIEALLSVPAQGAAPRQLIVTPAFIGLLGANGSLPLHHTERIATQEWQHRDTGARAFLDILSSRLVTQLFEAWSKYRLEYRHELQGRDALGPVLAALAGFGAQATPQADDVCANYAALLRNRPISALAIQRVLSAHFRVPVVLAQFHGCWDRLPANRLSTLGGPNPRLGYGATLGVRQWRADLRPRLKIGPLEDDQFQRFLPHGQAAQELAALLGRFGTPRLQYEVRLLLGSAARRPLSLCTRQPDRARQLGWNAFLSTGARPIEHAEIAYLLATR
jgi:type VI secretion system protein ImpH